MATDLTNMMVSNLYNSPQEIFHGSPSRHWTFIRGFGEVVVTRNIQNKIKAKLTNRGTIGVIFGLGMTHALGTYKIYNPKTKIIGHSRDVTFLEKYYGDDSVEKINNLNYINNDSDMDISPIVTDVDDTDDTKEKKRNILIPDIDGRNIISRRTRSQSTRITRSMNNLQGVF